MQRRRFVIGSLGLIGAGLAARPARAFRVEDQPPPGVTAALAQAERDAQAHARILAEVDAKLAAAEVPAETRQEVLARLSCPLCGRSADRF
jgi:hypothetical protein